MDGKEFISKIKLSNYVQFQFSKYGDLFHILQVSSYKNDGLISLQTIHLNYNQLQIFAKSILFFSITFQILFVLQFKTEKKVEEIQYQKKKKKMYCTYEEKEDLYEIFAYLKDVDEQIFRVIIEMFRKEKISDCLGYLLIIENQKNDEQYILQIDNLSIEDKEQKLIFVRNNIKIISNILNQIKNHDFNKSDYSSEIYFEKEKIQLNRYLKKRRLSFFYDSQFTSQLIDLKNESFENIKIKNTSLVGINFVRCNLSGSEFENVDISGMNLNGAQLLYCKWKNLKFHELYKLDGHTDYVKSVCFSPDGTILASGSADNSIHLWDVKTGQQKAKFDGHTSSVYSVSFLDGTTLVSGSDDKSIILWDVKTGQQNAKLDGHTHYVLLVCFSPDGSTLASGSYDKSGQQKAKLNGHNNGILSVCFSPYGTKLASGSYDKSICLWDVKTGQQKVKLDGHSIGNLSVCYSHDGTILASGSNDRSIRLWDVKTGQMAIVMESFQYASFLMVLDQLLLVTITLSIYGISRQEKVFNPQLKFIKISGIIQTTPYLKQSFLIMFQHQFSYSDYILISIFISKRSITFLRIIYYFFGPKFTEIIYIKRRLYFGKLIKILIKDNLKLNINKNIIEYQ
ncbi:unnamed protein product [Paramecium sonneborni]|uniref:Uncharacterized protein n=1 Tax=Paramecium sonneborni TaxID=65129 RepID=A0A8S1RQC2_9CILI|nr:unnamed protein product [Paramecium sonneborni]